jgi:hypothetical protein
MTYSPEEDPEVIEEMKIAETELNGNNDDKDDGGLESSDDDSTGEEDGDNGEGDWEDEDDDVEGNDTGSTGQLEKRKRKRKILSCVDKVGNYTFIRTHYG